MFADNGAARDPREQGRGRQRGDWRRARTASASAPSAVAHRGHPRKKQVAADGARPLEVSVAEEIATSDRPTA